jgi:diadenylate cyclase
MPRGKKKTGEEALTEAIKMVSPGTRLREGISAILQSHNGALICVGEAKKLADLSEGGVELNAPLTPQLLYELCKMDGAIILNRDASKISYANRFLKPDTTIPSNETGTRHRAAERFARQAKCLVIALSERRASVTLYVHGQRHVLDTIPTLLNKASQAIQTLEKYLSVLDNALRDLSVREFQDMVTIFDVCRAVQRYEMVVRIIKQIEPYILELGIEGRLVELQLQELRNAIDGVDLVIKDYYREKPGTTWEDIRERINHLSEQELLSLSNISQLLGYGPNLQSVDTYLSPRGYRLLHQTRRIPAHLIENLVGKFGNIQHIMSAPKEELVDVDGVGEVIAERVRLSLNTLQNQLALDQGRR